MVRAYNKYVNKRIKRTINKYLYTHANILHICKITFTKISFVYCLKKQFGSNGAAVWTVLSLRLFITQ